MIYAIEPSCDLPKTIYGFGIDYSKTRKFYRVNFKFFYNYGIFRANGYGPHEELKKGQLRKFYSLTCGKKAPQNFNELLKAFAKAGFTVTEIKLTGEYGKMREIVTDLVL